MPLVCLALIITMLDGVGQGQGVSPGSAGPQSGQVTFSRDIAPIVFSRCASCHQPGQAAPFSLLTYEDVRRHATLVALVTKHRYMPPWRPEPGHGDFAGSRRLSDREIDLIQQWVAQGMNQGDARDLPSAPAATSTWQLGRPDLVITMPEPYSLPADGGDVFRTFVIPIELSTPRYVKALEFLPGSPKAIHHANIKIDRSRSSRRLDDEDPGPGYEGGGSRQARFPDGHFLGWTPGQSPRVSEPGMAWHLEHGSDLVMELHLMPTGKPEAIQVSVGLFFSEEPPSRSSYMLRLGRQDIDIPPGEKHYVNEDSYTLPVDADVFAIQPHAHYLARDVVGSATLPDGTRQALIYIKEWDFRWQDVYRYSTPVSLPKGTTISVRFTYDNSTDNPRNPNQPPKRVTFGQASSSEMGSLWIQVLPRTIEDRQRLAADFDQKLLRDDIAGDEKMLETAPNDPRLYAQLASCYREAGRTGEAIAALERSVRLDPTYARHYELGNALLRDNKLDRAGEHFSHAVRLKPDFVEGFNDLGIVRHAQGNFEAAIMWYKRALQLAPEFYEAHYNMARALMARGDPTAAILSYRRAIDLQPGDAELYSSLASALASQDQIGAAIAHYRQALQIQPDLPSALVDLAWILATSNDPGVRAPNEAVRLAERVAKLTARQNATVLDTLAAAYAAAGQIEKAIVTAQDAIARASSSGEMELAGRIRKRLEFYAQHKP